MNQKNPLETRTIEKQPDLLDLIIDSTRDVGIKLTATGIECETFAGLCALAKMIFDAGACPKSMDSSKKVLIAMAQGRTVGLSEFQSMQAFYIVNGQATLWGNAPLAICRQHPDWNEQGFDEWFEVAGKRIAGHPQKWDDDTITAICQTQRGAASSKRSHFSVADAKKAGLWGQTGKLYGTYPFRMLKARARGYALNDNFGDSLKGIQIRETFDEEVDGKPSVSNVDELRNEIDKRKAKTTNGDEAKGNVSRVESDKAQSTSTHQAGQSPHQKPHWSETENPVVSGSSNKVETNTIRDRAKQLDHDLSALDQAREWLKTVYEKIPMKIDHVRALKDASMEEGTWISFEHIDSISDLEYLNRIAGRLEEMLSQAVGAKA